MEGNIPQGGDSYRYGSIDLRQGPVGYPLTLGTIQNSDRTLSIHEDDPSYNEEGIDIDGHNDLSLEKKGTQWQRVKWTDKMVKLLITTVSYVDDDTATGSDCIGGGGGRKKFSVLQKKGKWKSISKVMAQRGYNVSPQQCEDKFNDLNKRYKRLNDMLGRGTSCQVVENPALLDVIEFLTEKEKDDVRKILSSKQLFYEEMCSYHNGNRLHLPHDPALQRSMQLALRSRDDHFNDHDKDDVDDEEEDDDDVELDDHEAMGSSTKRLKQQGMVGPEEACDHHHHHHPQVSPESMGTPWSQKQWIEFRLLQLEEQRVQIQIEMVEIEKQRFRWQRFSRKRDSELEKLRMENERMKLENEHMLLELKRKEIEISGLD